MVSPEQLLFIQGFVGFFKTCKGNTMTTKNYVITASFQIIFNSLLNKHPIFHPYYSNCDSIIK